MSARRELPESLEAGPFTLAAAMSLGVTRARLRQPDVRHISRGLYRPASWSFELESAARALSEASPGAWISHVTAARLRSQLLPPWLADSEELHLSKPRALPEVRRKGIVGHTVVAFDDEAETVDDIRISTRSRTWLDLARVLNLPELVCMGDELVRVPRFNLEGRSEPFATLAGLRLTLARHSNLQGIVRARTALELMRVGADSGPETLLRLAMCDAGLPEPELQIELRPGSPATPTADLGYRRRRLAIQYDGGHHLEPAQIFSDRRRNKAFEAAGWAVILLTKEDLADGFVAATSRIKRVLRSAYVSPSTAAGF